MNFKIIIFEFIEYRVFVKRSENLFSCHVDILSTIRLIKKFCF